MNTSINYPKASLGFFPTPLVEMKKLSRYLGGPQIWIKRDDQTGLAFGGNKARKLEYLLGEALENGCDCVITAGAAQSNHCRQTAAGAASLGLGCHLALGGSAPAIPNGNLLLDELLGAKIYWSGDARKGELIPEVERKLRERGFNPFIIPYGGSNSTGALGFVAAMEEINGQFISQNVQADALIFASSSGATQAGLMVGNTFFKSAPAIIGVAIDKGEAGEGEFGDRVIQIANETVVRMGGDPKFKRDDLILKEEYVGAGYGVVGDLEREAIRLLAREEGILLDPVYTARAFGAMLDLIAQRKFGRSDTIVFWHTGGTPALFAYANDFFES